MSDYIVTQGTSGVWTYRTWHSGIAECWYTINDNVTFGSSTSWGNIYGVDNVISSRLYPFTFVSTPSTFASVDYCTGGSVWVYGSSGGSNTASPTYGFARPTSISSAITVTFSLYVIGKWK